ncbi:MAG: DUF167 domain-containing protein [Nanoarchaeota archaeon]
MIVKVNVKPNSGKEGIKKIGINEYEINVKEPARNNEANKRVISILSKEFGVSWKDIKLKNASSRKKYFVINN